jgi:choline kinase
MASLWFAKEFVRGSNFMYLHSDLLYHPDILAMTLTSQAEIALAVEETVCDKEMMKVQVNGLDLIESSKEVPLDQAFGEWTGIAKFTSTGWQKYLAVVEQLLAESAFNVYDTVAMNRLVQKERVIKIVPFQDLPFIEIDYPEDLKKARDEIAPQLVLLYSQRTF